jgi:serine O-acetyltransferase
VAICERYLDQFKLVQNNMIESKRDFLEYVMADMKANSVSDNIFKYFNAIYKYLYCLRKVAYLSNTNKCKLRIRLWQLLLNHYSVMTGITIGPNCFGKGLYLPHYGYVVVNPSARFGENCVVQCGVNVSESVSGGDKLYLGAGCKLMIGVSIKTGTIVGANAVVTKSFDEENIVVAGIPAKKISNEGTLSGRVKI